MTILEQNAQACQATIDRVMNILLAEIEVRRNALHARVVEARTAKAKQLAIQRDHLLAYQACLASIITRGEATMLHGSDLSVVKTKGELVGALSSLLSHLPQLNARTDPTLQVKFDSAVASALINQWGRIVVSSVVAENCVATGEGLARCSVNLPTTVTVAMRGASNQAVTTVPIDGITATLNGTSNNVTVSLWWALFKIMCVNCISFIVSIFFSFFHVSFRSRRGLLWGFSPLRM
jgi:hypothetical protein